MTHVEDTPAEAFFAHVAHRKIIDVGILHNLHAWHKQQRHGHVKLCISELVKIELKVVAEKFISFYF